MKKLLIIVITLLFSTVLFGKYNKASQLEIANKYADNDEIAVMSYNPGTGAEGGYVIYADLDNDKRSEMIIPYRIHKNLQKIENDADIYKQTLSIDVLRGKNKLKGVIKIELTYNSTPKVYLIVKSVRANSQPMIFVMANDGLKKNEAKCSVVYNSYDKKNASKGQKSFETDKMPWEVILYQFDTTEPTIVMFDTKQKQNYSNYYIRSLNNPDKPVKVSSKEIDKFEIKLKKVKKDINFKLQE